MNNKTPSEVSLDEVKSYPNLGDMLDEKAKEIQELSKNTGLYLLKKSKFYMNGENLREHIANYKGYAIMLKQENLKEEIEGNTKEHKVNPAIIDLNMLSLMKPVNGNIVRKLNPNSLHFHEKMSVVIATVKEIDKGSL